MLQGVHAETIVFTSYQQARSVVLDRAWPLIGTPGEFGGRNVTLRGVRPRRFRLRVTQLSESGKTVWSQLELHGGERLHMPLIRVELSFVSDGTNTRIRLRGSTVRDLAPASPTQGEMSRVLANEYARALLSQIANAIEARSAKSHPTSHAGAATQAVLQKRR